MKRWLTAGPGINASPFFQIRRPEMRGRGPRHFSRRGTLDSGGGRAHWRIRLFDIFERR
jgi:hypothetical protein